MLTNVICSFAVRKGIVSALVIEGGMVKNKAVEKIREPEVAESSYAAIIRAFKVALRNVRDFIQQGSDEYSVCFETSNSTFIKWVDNQYSKEAYQDEFLSALQLLQELPIKYAFHYVAKPKALVYADDAYCKKPKLSGLSIDGVDDTFSI